MIESNVYQMIFLYEKQTEHPPSSLEICEWGTKNEDILGSEIETEY